MRFLKNKILNREIFYEKLFTKTLYFCLPVTAHPYAFMTSVLCAVQTHPPIPQKYVKENHPEQRQPIAAAT